MNMLWLVSYLFLWMFLLGCNFLLLGTISSLGRLQWRLANLEATRPRQMHREGLEPGTEAPNFTLPSGNGTEISLSDYAGQRVLLVFTQSKCLPCHEMLPEFSREQMKGTYRVLVVNHGELEDIRGTAWAHRPQFPLLCQNDWSVSKLYKVYATPYAFVIDENGVIAAKGVVSTRQFLQYVLSEAQGFSRSSDFFYDRNSTVGHDVSTLNSTKEATYV